MLTIPNKQVDSVNRYFITGAAGFVAGHFIEHIRSTEPGAIILGTDRYAADLPGINDFYALELMDYAGVERLIVDFKPTALIHFASFSSVAESWTNPPASFLNNTNIFLNIVEAIRKNHLACRVLSIGSSEQYGDVAPTDVPLSEDHPMNPVSPYAVARVAQENLSRIYARSLGLDIVITRSFNHIGPGQRPVFVIPSIIKQFLEDVPGPVSLSVGDVSIVRDFLDVRDVVKAYDLLLKRGISGVPYNVCSGTGISIGQLIEMISKATAKEYTIVIDPAKIRPSDNRIIIGDNSRLREATGWSPSIPLEKSIADIIANMKMSR
jgi:GDP-4-dehydro-6-deoxy-D-mannose reductase